MYIVYIEHCGTAHFKSYVCIAIYRPITNPPNPQVTSTEVSSILRRTWGPHLACKRESGSPTPYPLSGDAFPDDVVYLTAHKFNTAMVRRKSCHSHETSFMFRVILLHLYLPKCMLISTDGKAHVRPHSVANFNRDSLCSITNSLANFSQVCSWHILAIDVHTCGTFT